MVGGSGGNPPLLPPPVVGGDVASNVAVHVNAFAGMVKVNGFDVPVQMVSPDHPANVEPVAAVAVSVTVAPAM